jgi:glycerophosphoryl diester phosphodiesterase
MKIISHRGLWRDQKEKNSLQSLLKSINLGFGFETDIRDFSNTLVISHDIPSENSLPFDDLIPHLDIEDLFYAWNIKADGLTQIITSQIPKWLISKSVFFDMSVPETMAYRKAGIPYLVRLSEYETFNDLYKDSNGVWIDSFHSQWFTSEILKKILRDNKKVFIVSSELHKRDHIAQWQDLMKFGEVKNNNVYLCTDYPEEAEEYFNGNN